MNWKDALKRVNKEDSSIKGESTKKPE